MNKLVSLQKKNLNLILGAFFVSIVTLMLFVRQLMLRDFLSLCFHREGYLVPHLCLLLTCLTAYLR